MSKNLVSWLLYDVANSFLAVATGSLFLAQWVILDNGFEDIWYGGTFTLATVLVLLSSPILGAWSDCNGKRLPFIKWLTVILFVCGSALVLIISSSFPLKEKVLTVLFLFLLIQVFYQFSLVFYNSLLEKLSSEKNRGKISGLGGSFGVAAYLLAIGIFSFFSQEKITLFGTPGRTQVFLPALIAFLIFSLPMMFLFREQVEKKKNEARLNFKDVYKKSFRGITQLFKENKNVARFLLGFCFVSDGILTIQLYFAIVMDKLYRLPDSRKFLFTGIMIIFYVIGSYILGNKGDILGSKRIIVWSSLAIIFAFSIAFLSCSSWILYFVVVVAGLGWGGFDAASRAFLVEISPASQLGEYFGFYSTFSKFSSIIGPLVWGGVILLMSSFEFLKYRVAGFSLIFLMTAGLLILRFVNEGKDIASQKLSSTQNLEGRDEIKKIE